MGPRTSGKSMSKKQPRGFNLGRAQVVEDHPSQTSNNLISVEVPPVLKKGGANIEFLENLDSLVVWS